MLIRLLMAAGFALVSVCLTPMPAVAHQTPPAPQPTTTVAEIDGAQVPDGPAMIPTPNRGVEPQRATDRGGSLQFLVMAAMMAAVVFMVVWVRRSGSRSGKVT